MTPQERVTRLANSQRFSRALVDEELRWVLAGVIRDAEKDALDKYVCFHYSPPRLRWDCGCGPCMRREREEKAK